MAALYDRIVNNEIKLKDENAMGEGGERGMGGVAGGPGMRRGC